MRSVPVIDLADYFDASATPAARASLLSAVDRALCEIGFLCVRGHQVPITTIEQTQSMARAFFEMSSADKAPARAIRHRTRGWTPLGDHSLGYSMASEGSAPSAPDLFERYRIGPFDLPDDDYSRARLATVFAPNVWPDEGMPGFRPVMSAWYRTMSRLSRDLMRVFALTLGMPERWFDGRIDREMSSLAINYYPVTDAPPEPGQLRASAHTDYGTLTIVAPTGEAGGLQVMTRDRGWQDIAIEPGTFVVNIGDLMAQWSNDRWVSTLHRVANPPVQSVERRARVSLVYFHQPNDDTLVECIPTCVDAEHPAKYPPVMAGEHIGRKIARHFQVAPTA
jgi:isopenicillin N synthase-like dioxygenase